MVLREERITVEEAFKAVVDTPVAPVMAPAPVMAMEGELRRLVLLLPKERPLMVLLAMAVTLGRLIPLMVLVPVVELPVKEIFKPLVTAVPAPELLVKDKDAKLSLLVEVVKMSDIFPDDNVKFPEVKVSLP